MLGIMQCPLLTAAFIAACGISLIGFSNVWPQDAASSEPEKAMQEQMQQQRSQAFKMFQASGLSGNVGAVEFGDGLGLGATAHIPAGSTIFTIPENLALDVRHVRSCPDGKDSELGHQSAPDLLNNNHGMLSDLPDESGLPLDCLIEHLVVQQFASKKISELTGLLTLLVMERSRGAVPGLEPNGFSELLKVLPQPSWQAEKGIFAIEEEEFKIFSAGTSMEGWQEIAVNETLQAHLFIKSWLTSEVGFDVTIDEVRWAYVVLHAFGQWVSDNWYETGIELLPQMLFLLPLFLARPTPEWEHGVHLTFDEKSRHYDVVAPHTLQPGD